MLSKTLRDVTITQQFGVDYDAAPKYVKRQMNDLVRMILDGGCFPKSFHPRAVYQLDNRWMGNVTQSKQAWRVFYWIEDGTTVVFDRLISHDERDRILRAAGV